VLRSVLLRTLRGQRWTALGWGIGLGVLIILIGIAWQRAYPTRAARALLTREVTSSLAVTQIFYGEPHHLDQLAGWQEWRGLGVYPLLLGLFAVIAATGATRGAEERGELEMVLATPIGRGRLFAEQAGGLLLVLLGTGLLVWLGLLYSGRAAGEPLDAGWAALAVLNCLAAAAFFGAVALLCAQLIGTRRGAALAAGGFMFAAHFWNNLGFAVPALRGLRGVSPMYLYAASAPLSLRRLDLPALLGLIALAALVATLAGILFSRRDQRDLARLPLPAPLAAALARLRPRGSLRLLGNPLARGLRAVLGTALVWGIGLGTFAAFVVSITPSALGAIREQLGARSFIERLQRGSVLSETGFLTFVLFSVLLPLLAIYALMLASAWAADEAGGRLEIELAWPVSRVRHYAARLAATLLAVALTVLVIGAAFTVALALAGLSLPAGDALAAVLLLIPLAASVIACGFFVAARRPGAVVAVTGAIVGVLYFLDLLAPLFGWPDALRRLSIFRLYGTPLLTAVHWDDAAILVAVATLLAVLGGVAFARKDLSR
jgi:ABC-2 type transport system permease protein